MDTSDVGRYGTLSLLKRLEPDTIVASYPIDEPEVTLGRDPSCSIRLYYPAVSALHLKIIFNENRAFLVVLGTNGALVDGCPVFPAATGAPPATVPLPNGSTIDVHRKRFRFACPPKHLRPALAALDTPVNTKHARRALRMSMISSAHVFSPRPSADPRANLRVLQSPLKAPFRPTATEDEDDNDNDNEDKDEDIRPGPGPGQAEEGVEDIVLVESNNPRVVEEERDLVILDHVNVPPPPDPPLLSLPLAMPSPSRGPPQTPRPGRPPRGSLHRAVLLRSAHRAALRQEMQREEEQEVEEVEESIVDSDDEEEEPVPLRQGAEEVRESTPVSSWRKSLDLMKGGLGWAFRGASAEPGEPHAETTTDNDTQMQDGYEHDDEAMQVDGEYEHNENDAGQEYDPDNNEYPNEDNTDYQGAEHNQIPQHETPPASPAPVRALGRFMTPQASRPTHARPSLGGSAAGPRRVRVVAPWKVTDIVVPVNAEGAVKEEDAPPGLPPPSPERQGTPRRERLSEEERRAIRERRRSALTTPDTFFNGRVPGMRPSPAQAPLPAAFPLAAVPEPARTGESSSTAPEEDPHVLLARMRQMVDGVKRRQSAGAGARPPSLSPRKRPAGGAPRFSLLAPQPEDEDEGRGGSGDGDGEREVGRELSFSVPAQVSAQTPPLQDLKHLFAPGPATPQYVGVRDLFKAPPAQATPHMDGVRDLFLRGRSRERAEPALEGVGELLATPAGWRVPLRTLNEDGPHAEAVPGVEVEMADLHEEAAEDPKAEVQEESDQQDALPEPEPKPAPAPPAAPRAGRRVAASPGPAARRTPRSGAQQKEKPAVQLDTVLEDASAADAADSGAKVVRRTRTRTATESDQEDNTVARSSIPRPGATRTRRTKASEEREPTEEATKIPTQPKPRSAARRRADASEDETAPAPAPTVRRSRRVAESPQPAEAPPPPPAAPKTLRRTRVTRTPVPDAPAPAPSTTRRGKTRAGSVDVDADGADDPLDTIGRAEDAPAPAAKVRRTRAPKVKEEEDVSPAPVPARGKAAGTRASARKAAAATPAEESGEDARPGDKENTPDADVDGQEEGRAGGSGAGGAKAKASARGTRRAIAPAKQLAATESVPAKSGARVARTRATGRK